MTTHSQVSVNKMLTFKTIALLAAITIGSCDSFSSSIKNNGPGTASIVFKSLDRECSSSEVFIINKGDSILLRCDPSKITEISYKFYDNWCVIGGDEIKRRASAENGKIIIDDKCQNVATPPIRTN